MGDNCGAAGVSLNLDDPGQPPCKLLQRGDTARVRPPVWAGALAKVHRTRLGASTGQGRLAAPCLTQLFSPLLHPNASHVLPEGWETWHGLRETQPGSGAQLLAGQWDTPSASPLSLPRALVAQGCRVQPLLLPINKLGFHLHASKCRFLCASSLCVPKPWLYWHKYSGWSELLMLNKAYRKNYPAKVGKGQRHGIEQKGTLLSLEPCGFAGLMPTGVFYNLKVRRSNPASGWLSGYACLATQVSRAAKAKSWI